MTDFSTSSTSQSDSKTKQPFHFRAKIEVQNIQVIANLRNLHQHTIKLSIKNLKRKQSNNTQEKMAARNQTKDLKCATHLLSDKFRNMSEEKKAIVRDLGFGGLMHIPPLRIGHALGINATGDLFPEKVDYKKLSEDDKIIFRRFQGKTLKSLTDEMMEIGVGNEEERLMFKRIFILYIQMTFLLPTTINKISPIHLPPIFQMDSITERNWGGHVLTFIVKGITDYKEKKKKAIDGCLFALMIIYFHLSKNKGKKRAERPPKPWIANWSKEQLVERITAEREEILASSTSSSETETTTDSDSSTSESETQEDSEDSGRKHPSKKGKKMDSRKRKKSQEESDSDSESKSESSDESEESSPVEKEKKNKKTKRTPKKTQPKKKKVVVEDSPPEEDQYFDGYSTSERYEISSEELDELLRKNVDKSAAEGENEPDLRSTEGRYASSETIPAVNLGSDDPSSQGRTEQSSVNHPSESMLSPVQQSASELAYLNMMVVREQTPSDALVIVPIQVFVPASQTTTMPELQETPESDFEPTPLLQIEGTTETHPAAEDVAALMMMAQTASYVPKTDPVPSFSLSLTDSSQEGASTQETKKAKSPETANLLEQLDKLVQKIARNAAKEESKSLQIQRETGGESSGKFETPVGINENTDDIKQKCYIWGTRVKTYADGGTNEYENMCTLMAQDKYILTKMHIASLQPATFIEAEIVTAMCLILNQTNDKRFQEQIYCLPPDIVNMAVSKHPNGQFISPRTNKEFRVEDYPSFIPFIDAKKKKLRIHIKQRFHILDPLHKKAPSEERKQLNKFTGYVISRMRAYVGREPLKKGEKEKEIKASYVKISGQKSTYDCAIYDEVDHYRVEYASRILFSEMSK
ncbi:uncharacterized protein DS421_9g283800 [Arachis hypogaea]|nr:uncharacterized protein DS421_9g283800 [Arachis hypogaea]